MTLRPENSRTRTLVVDDHPISRRHAVTALSRPALEIKRARSAEEALELALTWYPHVICMDLHLPGTDGITVIRKIRKEWPDERPWPRIIVMTGDNAWPGQLEMARLHVDHLLVKPVSGRQLRNLTGAGGSQQVGEPRGAGTGVELQALFRAELEQRLPDLDIGLALRDRKNITGILHQLIASAAMCGEPRLESSLRSLDVLCRQAWEPADVAQCYHAVLDSVREVLARKPSARLEARGQPPAPAG